MPYVIHTEDHLVLRVEYGPVALRVDVLQLRRALAKTPVVA